MTRKKIICCIILFMVLIFICTNFSYGFEEGNTVIFKNKSYEYEPVVVGYERKGDEYYFSKGAKATFVYNTGIDNICVVKDSKGNKYYVKEGNLRSPEKGDYGTQEQRASIEVLNKYKNMTDSDFKKMSKEELKSVSDECIIAKGFAPDTQTKLELNRIIVKIANVAKEKGMDVNENNEINYTIPAPSNTPSGQTTWDELVNEEADEINKEDDTPISDDTIFYQPDRQVTDVSSEENLDDMIEDADDFVESGSSSDVVGTLNQENLQNFSRTLYNILLAVGVAAAVIVGAILGIKIMTSSVEEKAEVKKLIIPYIVGCVIVFGGFTIWKLAVELLSGI